MFAKSVVFQLLVGLYSAPMQTAQPILTVSTTTGIRDTARIKTIYDTSAFLFVFGGCSQQQSCVTWNTGPVAGKNGSIGPWVDTVRFNRLYKNDVPSYVIKPMDVVSKEQWWSDTTILSSFYSPNVVFTIRKPDVLEFAKDSNHAIFRTLKENQEVYVVAKYNNKIDSIRLFTVPNGYCTPWPDCYYNPRKIIMPELPRVYLDTMVQSARQAFPSRIIRPLTGAQLQSALDTAKYGDRIILDSSIVYIGNFIFRKRNTTGVGWITLHTNGTLPPLGTRIRPSNVRALAKLESSISTTPVFRVDTGATNLRMVGLEMRTTSTATMAYTLVEFGNAVNQWTTSAAPKNIVVEQSWIHGNTTLDFQRCLALQSGATAIVDSWFSDCHGRGYDSQAICGWNGPGPYQIVNNYLEGAGENVMFGGSDPLVANQIPSDIDIRRNHFYKPPTWKGVWTVKNIFELKLGSRVLAEENVFENNWADAQSGAAILLRSLNQNGGAPWSETRDVTFRYNIIKNSSNGLNAVGVGTSSPAVPMSSVYVGYNSWEKIGNGDFDGGVLWQLGWLTDLTLENNTGFGKTWGIQFIGGKTNKLIARNNIIGKPESNIGYDFSIASAEGNGWGIQALNAHATTWDFKDNMVIRGFSQFPAGNLYINSHTPLNMVNPWNDLALGTTTHKQKDIGTNYTILRQRLSGVVVSP